MIHENASVMTNLLGKEARLLANAWMSDAPLANSEAGRGVLFVFFKSVKLMQTSIAGYGVRLVAVKLSHKRVKC